MFNTVGGKNNDFVMKGKKEKKNEGTRGCGVLQ